MPLRHGIEKTKKPIEIRQDNVNSGERLAGQRAKTVCSGKYGAFEPAMITASRVINWQYINDTAI